MFGTLQQGATIYVIDKTEDKPKLKIASVTSQNPYSLIPNLNQTVDISVSYPDGGTAKFEKLPSNLSAFAYVNAIVCETREIAQQQIESSLRHSEAYLQGVSFHEKAIPAYKEMLKELSPTYAKEQQTEKRLETLENGLGEIKTLLLQMTSNTSSKSSKS